MLQNSTRLCAVLTACILMLNFVPARAQLAIPPSRPNLAEQPTLYVVGYAHLDTQWRWEYPQTIGEYLPKTLNENFAYFEKYPNYIFNFSGARRYQMIKEYYPADYLKLKKYIAAGRWFPAGSSMDESDVNSPSAESVIRQILYGSRYFRREFDKTSAEYMLPDCFGFPASLPSILAHMGLKGFSTQKLSPSWQPSARVGGPDSPEKTPHGVPFNVGIWEGPDGRSVIAALNPGSYNGNVRHDLSKSPPTVTDPNARNPLVDWPSRIQLNGQVSGLFTDYHYYGVGDTGGAPREDSVRLVEAIVTRGTAVLPPLTAPGQRTAAPPAPTGPAVQVGDGPLRVISATAEQMFLDIKPDQTSRLPRYKGDLELINHSAGSLTSQTYQKRWNRHNEILADAAERASVTAEWLGGRVYPLQRLNDAWALVMGSQMHDIQPGTSTPKAFEYAWNDDVIAMNQFAGVIASATEATTSALNTKVKGTAIVVYNSLEIPREDLVEARINFQGDAPRAVRVIAPDGKEVPSQLTVGKNGTTKVLFVAKVPSVGYAVYDVQPGESSTVTSTLKVTESTLENARYRVRIDANGDLASIFDKSVNKELLASPARLALQTHKPRDWPAWNMDWEDQKKPPRAYVGGTAKTRIVENGPARIALEIARETEGSKFVQTIRLSAGDAGNRVEVGNVIDWKTGEAALKATFPLSAANPDATYNWDIGTIERGNNDERKFEVPSHQWFDLTDKSGTHGVTILSDSKYGSDKPDDNTLRLTLLYTPGLGEGNGRFYSDQTTQDWGHHEFVYGLAGHSGDWRKAQTDWQAYRLNQPLMAFESSKHRGSLGKTFSLMDISSSRVRALALKKAEDTEEVIVRVVEMDGKPADNVRIAFASPIVSAREVNGQEHEVGPANISKGELVTSFGPFQPRTFALKLAPSSTKVPMPTSQPVNLYHDTSVATVDGAKASPGFDSEGRSLPAEILPSEILFSGIRFKLAPGNGGKHNALIARGQTVAIPGSGFSRVYVLAASNDGDQNAKFLVGSNPVEVTIQDWGGYVGQWDNRTWNKRQEPVPLRPGAPAPAPGTPPRMRTVLEYTGLTPGFIKRAPIAWYASHRHNADGGNEIYAYSYLYSYAFDVPPTAKTLTLPDNPKIRILAVTASDEGAKLRAAQPLYDTLER